MTKRLDSPALPVRSGLTSTRTLSNALALAGALLGATAGTAAGQRQAAPGRTPTPVTPLERQMDPVRARGLALRPKTKSCPRSTACSLGGTINGLAYAGEGRYWVTDFARNVLRLVDVDNGCGELASLPAPGNLSPSENTLLGTTLYHWDFGTKLLYGIDTTTLAVVSAVVPPGDEFAEGLTNDGRFLWRGDSSTLYRFDPDTLEVVASFPNPPFDASDGLSMCGDYLLMLGYSGWLYQIDPSTGAVVASCALDLDETDDGLAADRLGRVLVARDARLDGIDMDCGQLRCRTIDFETEDDFFTPLGNGQHLDTEFGRFVRLTSTGRNAGLGVFDSTPGGPNDPSQDRDLLVGSGKILILQTENFPPDARDFFPRPNDDEDGGTITFDFLVPVEARALDLIDLDAGDGPTTVVLVDGPGRQRRFTVPSRWTGDLLLGQPGFGTLDLTTLAAQPGHGSVAQAREDKSFAARDVRRITVTFVGSGALDDLVVCPTGLPQQARSPTGPRRR